MAEVECDNESEVEGAHGIEDDDAYSINIGYLSDGEGDEELQAAKDNLRVGIENTHENDSDDYDIDENESSLASSDEEEDEATLRRKKFPKYNRNSESPQFCLGMLFTYGKEFKDAIYKYSRCNRRELKIMKNEPKRISVKCITSAKCPWRIYASTNRCRRAKNLVTSRLAGSCKEEFALLWDYADELRAKNPGSTINMEPIADGEAILLLRHLSYGEEPKDFRKNGLQRTLNRNPNQKPKVGKMKRTNT
ncbi:hypothetical protein V6N12_050902 [Hibiscus sabdariffa]|uniref:Transposase MuDR plant domain-containing protein n=1 Tax=Hibiscus sabdariffa TaxID=183260 RepID=A0ABR2GDQ2_9ROSI